jgi:hypothetical protein
MSTSWNRPRLKIVAKANCWPGTDAPMLLNPFTDHGFNPSAPIQPSATGPKKRGRKPAAKILEAPVKAFGTVSGTYTPAPKSDRKHEFGRKW